MCLRRKDSFIAKVLFPDLLTTVIMHIDLRAYKVCQQQLVLRCLRIDHKIAQIHYIQPFPIKAVIFSYTKKKTTTKDQYTLERAPDNSATKKASLTFKKITLIFICMENGSKCMLSAPILTGNSLSGTKPHPRRNKKLGHSSSTEHISKEKLHHQGKEESEE